MATDILVPTLGESVSEATIGRWFKKPGDAVAADEPIVELETDKVTLEVNAPAAGELGEILVQDGETVEPGALLGSIVEAGAGGARAPEKPRADKAETKAESRSEAPKAQAADKPAAEEAPARESAAAYGNHGEAAPAGARPSGDHGPAVAKLARESGVDPSSVNGSGKDGRVTKGDMLAAMAKGPAQAAPAKEARPSLPRAPSAPDDAAREERVRMTKLRQTIARRLKDAQDTAAMLTTFNDVDMSAVMAMRAQYKDIFEKKHGTKLGFMGFFTKAVIGALKDVPAVNAEIDGQDIVYKNYYHVGIAVGTDKGLVVPVVRDADDLSIAGIEKKIAGFGKKAREGKLSIDEMQGGTFTITNGGIYGSLMSTPILNAPQSGILGMHRIEERPVVRAGKIEARPMMYLALSYDHRIVDGKEAVTFLVRVKEALEDPARLVLDL
ncbi:2-oxoglutarate dehydrogenase complex dihydrolipoyllysine-residue succinyltransferase [Methylobacterium oxalidis]|uniref:Dihydrolipoyllysine-residue succinyltransferase component of 2-oxoglutarate dehydrogenase complex n=1 Tax=Methylobacterium oxalidis TaxID=944322 RepID=A0A512J7N9_9HYPH|nr:2-oxoglutarate dehydrogenase complex dihydrolipoyllysine-residue succinyltransferase [Methylobacterium oxalidis]GEP05985.1 dihydrolipoyllysine-residue succinyltransferase component of 2-oxoglutarate dehydrogenase complex [Methylobacterium oxalidis]GJE32351.1 Dihydrolipoyllysine-residue succinyltransferase component of 2-oxoglutarate dehydrogenase complex [Methylobacterium oxalidis]GLS65703.1 dihydrolipoyllysine-residue succinyltransferase component of 2-oxoglutarate dehydrogenase complex [Met